MFGFDHIEDILKGERLEVQAVAGVVVGGNRLGIAVHHHRSNAVFLGCKGGVAAAVVELDPLADAVGTSPQDHHLALRLRALHLVGGRKSCQCALSIQALQRAFVSGVVIRRGGGEFGCAGVDGLEDGTYSQAMAMPSHRQLITAGGPADLTIREPKLFQFKQGFCGELVELLIPQEGLFRINDASKLGEEPWIDAADSMDLLIASAAEHRGAERKNPIR